MRADEGQEIFKSDRVLVVSPDEALCSQLGALLEKRACAWETTPSSEAALHIESDEQFDLIICELADADLPRAPTLISRLRTDPRFSRSPLLLITAKGRHLDFSSNKEVETIGKPVDPSEFLLKVATQLRVRKLHTRQANFDAQISLQNAHLRELTQRFNRELREAQGIQRSILPTALPNHPECVFAASYAPLEAVAGDLFDIWEVPPDTFGLFVGDVTGHGLSAAFIGAMTKMALSYANHLSPDELLQDMNHGMTPHMPEGRFVTVLAATFNTKNRELCIARGGHPPPLIYRADKKIVESPSPRGLAIGFHDDSRYELFRTTLNAGDKVIFFTDGLTEATDMNGKMFGSDGMSALFGEIAPKDSITECIENILEAHEKFRGGRTLKDDLTIVGLEYSG